MRKIGFILICVTFFICLSEQAEAQLNRKTIKKNNKRMSSFKGKKFGFKSKAYNALGLSINAFNYYGDLSPKPGTTSTDIGYTRPAFGLSFMHRFGPRYSFLVQYMHGTLQGSDVASADYSDPENGKYRYWRNLSFRNKINELSAMAYFDLFENDAKYMSRPKWTPYIFLGLATFLHNPQAQAPATDLSGNPLPDAGEWVDLRPLGTEGQYSTLDPTDVNYGIKPYSKFQVAIPMGFGARFRLNDVLDLWAEIGFRYTFTDYLDDVSRNYVDLGVLNSPLSKAMSYRSNELPPNQLPPLQTYTGRDNVVYETIPGYGQENPDTFRGKKDQRDVYMVTSFRLTYILGATFHKAKFR
jgi:hypothetical protein